MLFRFLVLCFRSPCIFSKAKDVRFCNCNRSKQLVSETRNEFLSRFLPQFRFIAYSAFQTNNFSPNYSAISCHLKSYFSTCHKERPPLDRGLLAFPLVFAALNLFSLEKCARLDSAGAGLRPKSDCKFSS